MRCKSGWLAISACVVIAACATSPTPASSGPVADHVRVTGTGDPNDISYTAAGPSSSNAALEFPASRVWPMLPSVYSVLSIPLSVVDSTHQFVVGTVSMRRSFSDEPVSSLVDCGSSITGPNADNFTVRMKLTTQVEAASPEAARVRTIVDASGTGSAGLTVRCASTGVLEQQIVARLRQGLSR